jgi:predicted alpha/beta superfamily hydrolase
VGLPTQRAAAAAALPQAAVGRIERIEHLASRHVTARHIDVWLPADYSTAKRYQVLHMHDGQNLFDARLSYGGQMLQADSAVDRLVKTGRITDTIIVGIWNAGVERYAE